MSGETSLNGMVFPNNIGLYEQNNALLKDLLLMAWCPISQHSFKGVVETIPQWVRTFLLGNLFNIRQVCAMLLLISVNVYYNVSFHCIPIHFFAGS